jgi:hypothetical protein
MATELLTIVPNLMRILKFVIPALAFAAALVTSAVVSYGTVEMGKKEKKPCTSCHTKTGSKELNEAGKYYKQNKTLEKK